MPQAFYAQQKRSKPISLNTPERRIWNDEADILERELGEKGMDIIELPSDFYDIDD